MLIKNFNYFNIQAISLSQYFKYNKKCPVLLPLIWELNILQGLAILLHVSPLETSSRISVTTTNVVS